jgi:serine/threonine-protein kinase
MMKCPECQFENPDNTRFCAKCAAPLHSSGDISVSPAKASETPAEELARGTIFAGREVKKKWFL